MYIYIFAKERILAKLTDYHKDANKLVKEYTIDFFIFDGQELLPRAGDEESRCHVIEIDAAIAAIVCSAGGTRT